VVRIVSDVVALRQHNEIKALLAQTVLAASFGTVNDLLSQRIGDVGH
jgi:hypothetical protein